MMSPRGKKRLPEAAPVTQSSKARPEVEEGRDDRDEDSIGTEDVGGGDTEARPDIAVTPVEDILNAIEVWMKESEKAVSSQDVKALTPEGIDLILRYASYVSLNS